MTYMADDCTELTHCVACGHSELTTVIDLYKQPLANSYKNSKDEDIPYYPLAIAYCDNCHHVQLSHRINPDLMFKDYLYVTGTSNTMKDYCDWFSKFAQEYYRGYSGTARSVLDIGCNDGTQLDSFKKLGMATYGVDPAVNLYERSSVNHKIHCGYFDDSFDIPDSPNTYDIIGAQNVFAHTSDPLSFLQTASKYMGAESLMFVQTSQAEMILNNEFDTIYHEHISFFNIKSMDMLTKRACLHLVDVIKTPIHGTTYMFVISKYRQRDAHIQNLIEMETIKGLYSDQTYTDYSFKCDQAVANLKQLIDHYKHVRDFNVVGYGAAAKGNTVLNYSEAQLDFIVDDNPLKQGKYTPGSNIPIVSIDQLDQLIGPTLFVPLAWNFFKEIKSKIVNRHNNPDDLFLTYFPTVKIIV